MTRPDQEKLSADERLEIDDKFRDIVWPRLPTGAPWPHPWRASELPFSGKASIILGYGTDDQRAQLLSKLEKKEEEKRNA